MRIRKDLFDFLGGTTVGVEVGLGWAARTGEDWIGMAGPNEAGIEHRQQSIETYIHTPMWTALESPVDHVRPGDKETSEESRT